MMRKVSLTSVALVFCLALTNAQAQVRTPQQQTPQQQTPQQQTAPNTDPLRAVDQTALRRVLDSAFRSGIDSGRRSRVADSLALVDRGSERSLRLASIVVLGVLLAALIFGLLRELRSGLEFGVESHWGGFGGGVGGIQFSRPLVYVILVLVTGGMLAAVTLVGPNKGSQTSPTSPDASSKAAKTSAGGGSD